MDEFVDTVESAIMLRRFGFQNLKLGLPNVTVEDAFFLEHAMFEHLECAET